MYPIRAVTVYCSSSARVAAVYHAAAADLGRAIALQGWRLVYGGNAVGLMAVLADAARAAGGKVIGVTPRLFVDQGVQDTRCDELVVTESMRDRKEILEQRGDAIVALPGGIGTLEEWFEVLVGKQLRYHNKPIVLLNTDNFYAPLLQMIDQGIAANFIRPKSKTLFHPAGTVDDAIHHLRTYVPPTQDAKSFTTEVIRHGQPNDAAE